MKLRTGVFTAVFGVALCVIVAATLVTRYLLAASYRSDYQALTAEVRAGLTRELAARRLEMNQALSVITGDDTGPLRLLRRELQFEGGVVTPELLREANAQARVLVSMLGVDRLWLTGAEDRLWLAPHDELQLGEVRPSVRSLVLGAKAPAFVATGAQLPGNEAGLWFAAVAELRYGADTLWVVAARRLPAAGFQGVARPGLVTTRLVDAGHQPLQADAPTTGWRGAKLEIPLEDFQGRPAAFAQAQVSDEVLAGVLRRLTYLAAAAAVAALLLASLVAALLARRVTQRLERLVSAAAAVAEGDLTASVEVVGKDELSRLASAFNHMVVELGRSKEQLALAERTAAWQDIARHLAHEIKNPLTPIQMSMDTLRKSYERQHPQFGEILRESTATVLEEADRLRRFANEFGQFARLPSPMPTTFDIVALVRSLVGLHRGPAEVRLVIEGGAESTHVCADRDQLTQVLHNLLDNAQDAVAQVAALRPGHITVTVALRHEGARRELVLAVCDNGVGLAAEDAERVFSPYVTTKGDRGGTGLGLAIVWRIVHEHRGRIEVTAAEPGACFSVTLPQPDA